MRRPEGLQVQTVWCLGALKSVYVRFASLPSLSFLRLHWLQDRIPLGTLY